MTTKDSAMSDTTQTSGHPGAGDDELVLDAVGVEAAAPELGERGCRRRA